MKVNKVLLGAMLVGVAGAASAQATYDTSDVLSAIAAGTVAIGAIGAAIVSGPRVVKAVWGWIRGTVR